MEYLSGLKIMNEGFSMPLPSATSFDAYQHVTYLNTNNKLEQEPENSLLVAPFLLNTELASMQSVLETQYFLKLMDGYSNMSNPHPEELVHCESEIHSNTTEEEFVAQSPLSHLNLPTQYSFDSNRYTTVQPMITIPSFSSISEPSINHYPSSPTEIVVPPWSGQLRSSSTRPTYKPVWDDQQEEEKERDGEQQQQQQHVPPRDFFKNRRNAISISVEPVSMPFSNSLPLLTTSRRKGRFRKTSMPNIKPTTTSKINKLQTKRPGPKASKPPIMIHRDPITGQELIHFEYQIRQDFKQFYILVPALTINNLFHMTFGIPAQFKARNAVYPNANVPQSHYKGKRYDYETESNHLGWIISLWNEELKENRGLIQRAVDAWRNTRGGEGTLSRRLKKMRNSV